MTVAFLGGTTAGTSWRLNLLARARKMGIPEAKFFNPHLKRQPGQTGPLFTPEVRQREKQVKGDRNNLVLFYVCPGVPKLKDTAGRTPEQIVEMAEHIGLFTIYEMTKLMYLCPERIAGVIDLGQFSQNGGVRRRLNQICDEIKEDFTDEDSDMYQQLREMHPGNILPNGTLRCPLYDSLDELEAWLFPQLLTGMTSWQASDIT